MAEHGRYVLNEAGEVVPCEDLFAWGMWMETAGERRRVALTEISPEVKVSTVFLGLDHNFTGAPPILWETMVFGGRLDQQQEQYTSREDADAGHQRWVQQAREQGDRTCAP